MLARRFTIVCLLMTLFGLVFAILVEEASRSPRKWVVGEMKSCLLQDGVRCRPVSLN